MGELQRKQQLRQQVQAGMPQLLAQWKLKPLQEFRAFSSPAVVLVQDRKGQQQVLKVLDRGGLGRWGDEAAALPLFPAFPQCQVLQPGVLLMEYLPGQPLAQDAPLARFVQLGHMLRSMHGVRAPLPRLEPRVQDQQEALMAHKGINRAQRNFASYHFLRLPDKGSSLLHGDLHCGNVQDDGQGLRLLDPMGMTGQPAYDLAMVVASLDVPRHGEVAGALLQGYGSTPPGWVHFLSWLSVARYANALTWKPQKADGILAGLQLLMDSWGRG